MIRLAFTINREVLQFVVKEKEIYYTDKKWKKWVRCVPKDPKLSKMIRMSRNKIPAELLRLFELTDKEKKEYDNAKDEKELTDIIVRDAALKGCKLMKRMEE